jgi:signal transduction histidine kinase
MDHAAAIRALPRDDAALGRAVELSGVVTFAYAKPSSGFVLHDSTAGIYVEYAPPLTGRPPSTGTKVRLRGITGPGQYAPVVFAREIETFGTAPLPEPLPASLAEMLSGKLDCQYIEVEGVVQQIEERRGTHQLRLELATETGLIPVYFPDTAGFDFSTLIDATVLIRGVCLPFFNERGQLAGIRIGAASAGNIVIQRPAASDPFSAPMAALDRLLPFSPAGQSLRRRRVSGTVTFIEPGQLIYIQEGSHALRVDADEMGALAIGDRIEAAGFLRVEGFFAGMQRAQIRRTGAGAVPAAIPVDRKRVLALESAPKGGASSDFHGCLVAITGRLERIERTESDGLRLFIDDDGQMIVAKLSEASLKAPGLLDNLRRGSLVRLTGICLVEYSQSWPAVDFAERIGLSLLLRSEGDIETLDPASWWTAERLGTALASLGGLLLLASAWVVWLKRQVAIRSAQLGEEMRTRREAEIEFEATLRERERLAADLHDTLEQSLAGVSFQLEASESFRSTQPSRSDHHLRLAQQLVARSQEDVRRSVWNLHAQALDGRSLGEALKSLASHAGAGRAFQITTFEEGSPRAIPDFAAAHLLLVAQESITNAIKHASPRLVKLCLGYRHESIDLAIEDDGCGFDPATAPGAHLGHFGLQGIAERVKRLGGRFQIESRPGAGTRILVTVPDGFRPPNQASTRSSPRS